MNRRYRVCLVQPRLSANRRHERVMPMPLLYAAAWLREHEPDVDVRIVDLAIRDGRPTGEELEWLHGADLVGITAWTLQVTEAYELADEMRARGKTVVIGGPHAAAEPEEATRHADIAVIGEGEQTLLEIVRAVRDGGDLSEVLGIAYREGGPVNGVIGGRFQRNGARPVIDDLDDVPFPAWDLVDVPLYEVELHVSGGARLPVIGSRGCPYTCTYCQSPMIWNRKVRFHSPERIVAEIDAFHDRWGWPSVHFWDDNLMIKPAHLEAVCNELLRLPYRVNWVGLSRAEHVLKCRDILPLMKEAGCVGMEIGIESANPETFELVQKRESLETILEAAELEKAAGIAPLFTYMAFNPGETVSGYYSQARFIDRMLAGEPRYEYFHACEIPIYNGQMCTPHVGTGLKFEAPELGEVLSDDYRDKYHHQVNFLPESLLADVPALVDPARPTDEDLAVVLESAWGFWYAWFPGDLTRREGIERAWKVVRGARELCDRADGRRTLRAIAEGIRDDLGWPWLDAVRSCAFGAYVLAQIAVLKSADSPTDPEDPGIRPTDPARAARRVRRLLRWGGLWHRVFGGDARPAHDGHNAARTNGTVAATAGESAS